MSALVLVSGGLDSAVLVAMARARGVFAAGLHFVYPHPAQSQERRAVIALKRRLYQKGDESPFLEFDLNLRAASLAAGVGVPGPRVVPARNLAMVAIAANIAGSMGIEEVWIGANAADSAGYPDCRPDYLRQVAALTDPFSVTVCAPLATVERRHVAILAEALGIDRGEVWSCYQPRNGEACGVCGSCAQGACA